MQHPNSDTPWFAASPNTPKHRDRVISKSIIWTEKAALQETECCHPDCDKPVVEQDAPLPMCERHTTEMLYWSMRAIRAEVDAAAAMLASIRPLDPPVGRAPFVYYARIDDTIKIGTSTQLAKRMYQLKAELLAYEPGSYDLEAVRHREYALANSHTEYFHPSPELIGWIKILRGEAAAA